MPRFAVALFAVVLSLTATAAATADGGRPRASRDEAMRSLDALDRAVTDPVANPAAGACPPRPAAMADTVFRLHTELMQASLACADAYGEPDAYGRYRAFTRRHADILRDARATMVRRLSDRGDGRVRFDAYRTDLANEESRFLNSVATDAYCAARESRFRSLIDAPPDAFEAYAAEVTARKLTSSACRRDDPSRP